MKPQQFDGLCTAIESALVQSRDIGFNDAQTAWKIAHATLGYLEQLPDSWRIQ